MNLSGSGLTMTVLIFLVINVSFVFGQTEITVKDHNGDILPGAHVSYRTTENQKVQTVLTDINGSLSLKNDFEGDNIIVTTSYMGFLDRTDTLKKGEKVIFQLTEDEVTLNQVVVTGQYAPNSPDKSVHKIKIIDSKQMEARGVVNLNDALQFETNMRISQDNMLGSSASVQGLSGENVKIMIDGVPVIGRQDGNIDLNQINMNDIERIEIVEGPLSVNYGTNALAGTINLITKKDQKNKYKLGVNTYYESVGQYNIDGSIGYKKGDHRVNVSGGRNFFDGWNPDESFSFLPQSRKCRHKSKFTMESKGAILWKCPIYIYDEGELLPVFWGLF